MSGFASSVQYTIGTAIERAREQGQLVEILLEGQWICGYVAASDGHGVVLANAQDEHAILRLERVSAVRVLAAMPMPGPDPDAAPGPRRRSTDRPAWAQPAARVSVVSTL